MFKCSINFENEACYVIVNAKHLKMSIYDFMDAEGYSRIEQLKLLKAISKVIIN